MSKTNNATATATANANANVNVKFVTGAELYAAFAAEQIDGNVVLSACTMHPGFVDGFNAASKKDALSRSEISDVIGYITAEKAEKFAVVTLKNHNRSFGSRALSASDYLACEKIAIPATASGRVNVAVAAFNEWCIASGITPDGKKDGAAVASYPRSKSVDVLYKARDEIAPGGELAAIKFNREHFAVFALPHATKKRDLSKHGARAVSPAELVEMLRARYQAVVKAVRILNAY